MTFWVKYGKIIYNAAEQNKGLRIFRLKSIRVMVAVTVIAVIFLCSVNVVSAQSSNEASVSVLWVNQTVHPGDTVTVIITLTSNSADQLVISRIGLHFDWMEENQFYTSDLTANPVTVPAGSTHAFDTLAIQIPPYVTAGSHSYYVAVDGAQGSSSTPWSWDSDAKTVEISAGGANTAPTNSPTSTADSGGQGGEIPLNYLAIIAAVVVVVVALVVVVMWTKRKKTKSAAPAVTSQSDAAKPEEKPAAEEQKPTTPEDKSEASEYSI